MKDANGQEIDEKVFEVWYEFVVEAPTVNCVWEPGTVKLVRMDYWEVDHAVEEGEVEQGGVVEHPQTQKGGVQAGSGGGDQPAKGRQVEEIEERQEVGQYHGIAEDPE